MKPSRTQLNNQEINTNFIIEEMLSKEAKDAFLFDFQEFFIDENTVQFNLELI